jgi:hypothetical protein
LLNHLPNWRYNVVSEHQDVCLVVGAIEDGKPARTNRT